MGGLFKQIEGPIRKVIADLLSDENLAEEVTYRKYRGQAFSEDEGHNVEEYDESNPTALRLRHSLKSASTSQGNMQAGDMFFLFEFADLPEDISMKDQIVDANGKNFSIAGIDKIFGLAITVSVNGQ